MHDFSLSFLRCSSCGSKLICDVFVRKNEIIEGMLICNKCNAKYPVINKVPILWDSFANYLSNRPSLGGYLFSRSTRSEIKQFIKNSLGKIKKTNIDQNIVEKRWAKIYQNNSSSKFYSRVCKNLLDFGNLGLVLDCGCSIGTISSRLSEFSECVFGIDSSFSAVEIAKNTFKKNLDYFVADSMSCIFGKTKFDNVLALNILELVEPIPFIKKIFLQTGGNLIISDPYDYDRGQHSVKNPLYAKELRETLQKLNFKITNATKNPSEITWTLNINPRCSLRYKVDLIIANKQNT